MALFSMIRKYKLFVRIDIFDLVLALSALDSRLAYVLTNRINATKKLEKRIDQANFQNNAALVWDNFSGRGVGKSWLNYYIAYKILKSRGVDDEWKDQILFKVDDEIINTPSRWTEGIKYIADQLETIDDGPKWALLQDELSSEWGKGRVKQAESQKDAINELRKLGLLLSFASPTKDDSKIYDFRLFTIGYSLETGMSASILYFTRPQGVVFLKIPTEVREFLKKNYDEDARIHVLNKARAGFYTTVIDPDSDENGNGIQNNDDDEDCIVFHGDNFVLLRNIIRRFWISAFDIPEPYARVLTSYYLWSDKIHYANSKKVVKPEQVTIKKLPIKAVSVDWSDEVGVNSLSQGKHNYYEQFKGFERKLNTHHQEEIGESYAKIVFQNAVEHLNLSSGLRVTTQFACSTIVKNGKPYDVVLTNGDEQTSLVAINHKLLTSSKRIGKTQLNDSWGISGHPFQILWLTYTRPFKEIYYLKMGLGAQSEWKKVNWEKLMQYIEDHINDLN